MGEGAGVLVLEEEEAARSAARILGYLWAASTSTRTIDGPRAERPWRLEGDRARPRDAGLSPGTSCT